MHTAPSPALRALLVEAGYVVLVRTNGWYECLVHRGTERWIGRGASEDDALGDVLGQILPSHLARALLERHLIASGGAAPALQNGSEALPIGLVSHASPHASPLASPLASPTEALQYAATEATLAPLATTAAAVVPTVAEVAPEAEVTPAPAVVASVASAAPVDTLVVPSAPVEVAPVARAAEPAPVRVVSASASATREVEPAEKPARPRASDALDTVEKLLAGVESRIGSLARMSADRQRLHMLVCICRARAVEESMPGVRDVEHAVARVARRLTEIGKMFWPGSVRALQLSARPADVRREMHATWASEPTNWVEATSLAERLLDDHMAKSNDAGLDEDGWADGPARTPRPTDPDALFEEVDAELKAILIPPGEVPNGRLAELTPTELEALINAARRLRWLRGAVKDDLAWGIAMGRLRRAVPGLGDRAARVRDVLDQRHKPSAAWAKLLGEREAEAPESNVTESPAKLLADLPAALENKETMMAWLIRAFDVLNTPDLVNQLQPPHRELLASFGEEELNHSDRRVRRRLRDLVKRMAEAPAPATPIKPAAKEADEDTTPDDALAATALDALSARVRAQTTGSRALFVSNREDPELGTRLEELLGITITWCDGSLRRVQAQCERISRGSYDLVLSATGFQVHGVDSALARASSAAGIPYVRVNRGRPVACVQAIAREFGLTTTTQTVGPTAHAKASC